VSYLSSSQILVQYPAAPQHQYFTGSSLANSAVLEKLLPQLSIWQKNTVKKPQMLEKIDPYMLEETQILLKRISQFCSQSGVADASSFKIKLGAAGLQITGPCAEKDLLGNLINQDSWIHGAFNWLHPNYVGLAHSQELLSFSCAYEKNRSGSLEKYRHFTQHNQGLDCYITCEVEEGQPKLTWCLESPVAIYQIQT
jgi:hypothetical protein